MFRLHPITRRRIQRFRRIRYAWWAFWLLAGLYALSLGAELICNDRPLAMRFEGRWMFPAFQFVPEDVFLDNGRFTRPDYKDLAESALFRERDENRMWFAPIPYGPREIIPPEAIDLPDVVDVAFEPVQTVAAVYFNENGAVVQSLGAAPLFGRSVLPTAKRRPGTPPRERPAARRSSCRCRRMTRAAARPAGSGSAPRRPCIPTRLRRR